MCGAAAAAGKDVRAATAKMQFLDPELILMAGEPIKPTAAVRIVLPELL